MSDVLIAGGGVAGASLALLLGRRGVRVELVERDTFPREKPCGEGLMPAGVRALERWGLAGLVDGAEYVGVRYYAGGVVAEGRFPAVDGRPAVGRGVRRWRLDRALFEAAASTPGVVARPGVAVEGPVVDRGRVVGVVVGGEERRAGLVVAADGLRSPLRRALGLEMAPGGRPRVGVRVHYRLAPEQPARPWVEVYLGRGHELYVTPLPEGELLVAALIEGSRIGPDAADAIAGWIAGQPGLAARLRSAERITAPAGRAPLAARARRGWVPGCVLLGDAAGYVDPITGGGMTQAMLSAELLASSIAGGGGLAAFDADRRGLLRDYEVLTRIVLGLAKSPRVARATVGLMRARPGLFGYLLGVAGGTGRLLRFPLPLGEG